MDADLESAEIVFAQRLASGEPIIRQRALKLLKQFVSKNSKEKSFTDESMMRFCKGLHYAMWMQDKMLLQEQLADDICNLVNLFAMEDQVQEFVRAFFFSLSKEWPMIDRWRMDKFLMLFRRLFRVILARLRDRYKWDEDAVSLYIDLFRSTVISPDSKICESLKYHFSGIYLDELDNCGNLSEETIMKFLTPYADLLQEDISDSFFRTICSEIFDAILHDFSASLVDIESDEEESAETVQHNNAKINRTGKESLTDKIGFKFNYGRLAELLLQKGAPLHVPSKRRKRIYTLSKRFENVTKGIDPYPPPVLPNKVIKKWRKKGRL
ncbi:nucleolar protein,Nop52 domain-containing protein [Ditylenchus destructor]|uniref:Nucleolar protein,Nop52 domain-containing protein n=1 Tax=Ditylenchus destructor TaxID=166010 RepID=A0AAD4R5A6_9BILA|nr:nucleolar protein,Nop52 domain-containing protein [Ditylenchus destructor]